MTPVIPLSAPETYPIMFEPQMPVYKLVEGYY